MRKLYLTLLSLGLTTIGTNSQVQLNQNFESGTTFPSSWINLIEDNGTAHSEVSAFTPGWVVRAIDNASLPNSKYAVGTTSYFTNSAIEADRWLISPAITPGTTNTFLSFDIWSQDPSYLEGYEVRVAPNGGSTAADFTDLLYSTTAAPSAVTKKTYNLSTDYAGDNIRFAIRQRAKDKFILFADNFLVETIGAPFVVKMKEMDNTEIFEQNDSYKFKTAFSNYGFDTVRSVTIHYQVDANPAVSENITNATVPYLGTRNHTFTTPYNLTATGSHTVKFWITSINGGALNSTDTISYIFNVASKSVDRRILIEHFTNTGCGPCAAQNPGFKNLTNQFPDNISSIKYHPSFPSSSDPFYVFNKSENTARLNYYKVNGVPHAVTDGNGYANMPGYFTSTIINNAINKRAFAEIELNAILNGNNIDIDVVVKPHVTSSSSTTVLHVVVVEDITRATAPGSNGEKDFPQVMRKMLPNQNGTDITGFADGDVITKSFTYAVDTTKINVKNAKVVVFVQQVGNKYVYQSEQMNVKTNVSVKEEIVNGMNLFPNPAKEFTNLTFDLKNNSEVNVAITSMEGKTVSYKNYGQMDAGLQTININTSNLSSGVYFITINNNNGSSTKKLIVQ